MPPKGTSLPSCGFAVRGTKKGELPLKTEKRARGKKVTLIPNVVGDASKLMRALQPMLGVGGTVRRAEGGSWTVEVQGDQIQRVTRALIDFECLQSVSREALQAARSEAGGDGPAVARTAASKFLAQTQDDKKLSPQEERRRLLEQEAEFYGRFWQAGGDPSATFLGDVWEDSLLPASVEAPPERGTGRAEQALPELNAALKSLGMLSDCGAAVREFWDTSRMTVSQFRREVLRWGARLITDGPARKKEPSNLTSRQKISALLRSSGRANYFSCPCSAIDDYQRGVVRSKEPQQDAGSLSFAEQPKTVIETDAEGWCCAVLSYCAPLRVPNSRLDEDERSAVSRKALRAVAGNIDSDMETLRQSFGGIKCHLNGNTFGLDCKLHELDFLHGARREAGKQLDCLVKEELKLEKKLREIADLQKREREGEVLEKLQTQKVQRKSEFLGQAVELELKRAEKDMLRIFKRHEQSFQDAFWDLEWKALYGDDGGREEAGGGGSPSATGQLPFGTFDEGGCEGPVTLNSDGSRAESRAATWTGARLHLSVGQGEVAAFAVEILEGLVRIGWAAPGGAVNDLGADRRSFGFGGTGRKVTSGTFEPYGQAFKAGDVIHCEAEREAGRLRIGFAKNQEPLGLAFDVSDPIGVDGALVGAVCGKGFHVRLVSAECMPLEEAPGLDGFVEYSPARMAFVERDFREEAEGCLILWAGETVNVSSSDGEGWFFGYFLDPEDPEDGGWFPAECVHFVDEEIAGSAPKDTLSELKAASEPTAAGHERVEVTPVSAGSVTPAPAPKSGSSGADVIDGLGQWLRDLSLQKHEARAIEWCRDMGAVSLQELEEEWEALADALSLKPLERKRLAKAAGKL